MGHLVIEEQLWQVIRESLPNPSALDDARLSFAQLVALAEAVTKGDQLDTRWPLVRRLNWLRNRYAHQIQPETMERDVGGFLTEICQQRTPGCRGPISASPANVVTGVFLLWLWIDPSPTFANKEIEDDPMWK